MRRRRRSGAGRPRKPGMKRYANGRIVQCAENREAERGMTEREALSVGLAARKRHFGVTKSEARRATTGYLLGRLLELGRDPKHRAAGISRRQHDAGLKFSKLRAAFRRVMGGPKAPDAVDLTRIKARGNPANDNGNIAFDLRIRQHYSAAATAVASADPMGLWTLEAALDDLPLTRGELASLRTALNALVQVFRL